MNLNSRLIQEVRFPRLRAIKDSPAPLAAPKHVLVLFIAWRCRRLLATEKTLLRNGGQILGRCLFAFHGAHQTQLS